MDKKRTRKEYRLSSLPPDLQLRILSCLDAKDAVKISILSKTSVSLWTWIPLLKFNFSAFNNLRVFDKFVNRVLRLRGRSATLDRLTFTRVGICSAKTLNNVFKYALSHGVKQLEVYIQNTRNRTMVIGYNGVCYRLQEKKSFDDLLSLFCALHDVKSLTLFSPIVDMLTLFQHQLVKRSSPFRKLKCVKLKFTYPKYQNSFDRPWSLEPLGMPSDVKSYFLQNSPDAKVTMIYPE